ncbi:MAG: helix-turn-helix transcriptional regulator [Clostridia bacterium]|nr:helix-turn-helix transcriptional regulator [Clostridia bacterium]
MVINNVLGERIGNLRIKSGISQTALAKMLRVSRNAVNQWEMSMSNPSLANVIKLAQIFNVTVDYLLTAESKELIDVSELSFEEKEILYKLISRFKNK